jgi:hypothetical protein
VRVKVESNFEDCFIIRKCILSVTKWGIKDVNFEGDEEKV